MQHAFSIRFPIRAHRRAPRPALSLALLILIVGVAALGGARAARADGGPTLGAQQTSGSNVKVTGAGFTPGARVDILVQDARWGTEVGSAPPPAPRRAAAATSPSATSAAASRCGYRSAAAGSNTAWPSTPTTAARTSGPASPSRPPITASANCISV
jgi:hypothetical protein